MKKIIALALALIMSLSLASVAFAVTVDNSNAQTVLHGASAGQDLVLELTGDVTTPLIVDWRDTDEGYTDATLGSGVGYYVYPMHRDMANVTVKGNGSTKFAGFTFNSGLTKFDGSDGAGGHHVTSDADFTINTLTFENIVFTGNNIQVPNDAGPAYVDTVVYDHVTFNTSADVCARVNSNHVENVIFTNCTFNAASKAAIEVRGDGASDINITVDNCTFDNPARAILLNSGSYTGDITITNNKISTDNDRAFRITNLDDGASVTIENNTAYENGKMVDGDNEILKIDSIDPGATLAVSDLPAGAITIIGANEYQVSGLTVAANGAVAITSGASNPGKEIVVSESYARADYKVKSYDFTTGTRDFKGASYIEEIKINKDNELVIVLKDNYKLAVDKSVKGEIVLQKKSDKTTVEIPVEYLVANDVREVYGERKPSEAIKVDEGENILLVMDEEEGGYVYFEEEMLTGTVKMNKGEKTFLNVIYGGQEETIDAIEEVLGEEYLEEAIIEYYEFETRAFKNEVAFSYEAYEDDPHYFYLYNDGKLTKIDAKYNDDEEVEAWEWTAIAEGTIIVTDVEIVLADETTKNPDTGANDVVGVAAALAVVSIISAAAVAIKK